MRTCMYVHVFAYVCLTVRKRLCMCVGICEHVCAHRPWHVHDAWVHGKQASACACTGGALAHKVLRCALGNYTAATSCFSCDQQLGQGQTPSSSSYSLPWHLKRASQGLPARPTRPSCCCSCGMVDRTSHVWQQWCWGKTRAFACCLCAQLGGTTPAWGGETPAADVGTVKKGKSRWDETPAALGPGATPAGAHARACMGYP